MQINLDPRQLTDAERKHVAAFISGWPAASGGFVKPVYTLVGEQSLSMSEPATLKSGLTFGGKTEAELLADEQAADMQPLDAADDNTDAAAAVAAFTPSATPDRDGEGLPWDKRIHSSSKAINADGRWRIARNIAPELIESVKAELKALVAAPVVAESAALVPPPPVDVRVNEIPPPPPSAAVEAFNGIVSTINVADIAIDPAPTTPDLNVMFTTLLRDAGQAVVAQRISSAELTAICVKHGVANVGLLASRKDLVPQIGADFRALLASKVHP